MKKYMVYAVLIGCLGMLLMSLLVYALKLDIIHPFVLPVLIIFAVILSETLIIFKLSTDLSAPVVMVRVLQTTVLSTVITNLPMLASAGYLWFLRTQQPGRALIQTAHTNYYRDAPEVAFDVFVLLTLIGLGLTIILNCVARYFASRRIVSKLSDQTA